MPTGQKSPLHPSALTINGLTPGRTIVKFNRHLGVRETYVVMERPVVRTSILSPAPGFKIVHVVVVPPNARVVSKNVQAVLLRDVKTGEMGYQYLGDLGVTPHHTGGFNEANFVVDHRKKHLLPTELKPYPEYQARAARHKRHPGLYGY